MERGRERERINEREFICRRKIVVNSLIEEIHLIFGEVSFVKCKYTCTILMWSDKSSCESSKRECGALYRCMYVCVCVCVAMCNVHIPLQCHCY